MSGFDDLGVFYSDNLGGGDEVSRTANLQAAKRRFKEFLRQFHEGNFLYKYRYVVSLY